LRYRDVAYFEPEYLLLRMRERLLRSLFTKLEDESEGIVQLMIYNHLDYRTS